MGDPKATQKRVLQFNEVAYKSRHFALGIGRLHEDKNRRISFVITTGYLNSESVLIGWHLNCPCLYRYKSSGGKMAPDQPNTISPCSFNRLPVGWLV
jgi:hypothetical protein